MKEELKDGEPCAHPGCLHHVMHPCEGCGRLAGGRDHLTKEDILALCEHNDIVYRCVMMAERGDVTWEQALMIAVTALCEHNRNLMESLIKMKLEV